MIKHILKIILIVLLVLALMAAAVFAACHISGTHRSDPGSTKHYDTDNPFISEVTQISAHRNGGGIAPEESLMALSRCAEASEFSVDVFEFDLHITADDQLVLLHDDTLDRTSDSVKVFGEKNVRPENKTLAELKQLNMGVKFIDSEGNMPYADLKSVPDELRIVSLPEALDYLSGIDDFSYIIEVKNGGELGMHAVDILYNELASRDLLNRAVFGTFSDEVAAYAGRTYPDLARGASPAEVVKFYLAAIFNKKDYRPSCSVLQLPFSEDILKLGINLGTSTVINYAHSHNLALQYWTVNDPADMEYLVSVGADCIMTDYPNLLYEEMYS